MRIKVLIDDAAYDALPQAWKDEGRLEVQLEEAVNRVLADDDLMETEIEVEVTFG